MDSCSAGELHVLHAVPEREEQREKRLIGKQQAVMTPDLSETLSLKGGRSSHILEG